MNKNNINNGFGISLFVMIFMILCLSIFATLTYVQSNYNYNESKKIVDSRVAYYDADYKAMEIYNELKDRLDNNNLDDVYLKLKNIEYLGGVYCYNIVINENKSLNVELEYKDGDLNILTYKEVVKTNGDYKRVTFVD